MAKPNTWDNRPVIRSTREATAESKSVKPHSTPPECKCPLSIVTYVRWGNASCPYGADTIYSGFAAGSDRTHEGAAADLLCLPPNPQYLKSMNGYQNWGLLYGVEYETAGTPVMIVICHVLCVKLMVILTR